jgi:hypothetical protein
MLPHLRKAERISNTVEWNPKLVLFPHQNVAKEILSSSQQIICALQTQTSEPSPSLPLINKKAQALQHLCEILTPEPTAPDVAPPASPVNSIPVTAHF